MHRELRLLTWNVRDMLGDPLAVHRVIRAAQPDILCLQESPRWPGSRFQLRRLAHSTGLTFIAGGRSAAGCSVLIGSRVTLISEQAVRLPVQGWRGAGRRGGRWPAAFAWRPSRPRGVVLLSVAAAGDPEAPALSVACVHLGLSEAERVSHVAIIGQHLAGQSHLAIAGDLNEPPSGRSWRALSALVQDPAPDAGPTYLAAHPAQRIDAVLVNSAVRVLEYDTWRPDERDLQLASDHRPVLAVLETTTPTTDLGPLEGER